MRQAGIPVAELAQRAARRGAVDVDLVVDARVEGRDHERLPLVDEAEVGDEPGVEHGVDRGAVVDAALGQPPDARARTGRCVRACGHARKRTDARRADR